MAASEVQGEIFDIDESMKETVVLTPVIRDFLEQQDKVICSTTIQRNKTIFPFELPTDSGVVFASHHLYHTIVSLKKDEERGAGDVVPESVGLTTEEVDLSKFGEAFPIVAKILTALKGKVCIAGGSLLSYIRSKPVADFDMFIIDPDESVETLAPVIEELLLSLIHI
jgi:hypothetical protein